MQKHRPKGDGHAVKFSFFVFELVVFVGCLSDEIVSQDLHPECFEK